MATRQWTIQRVVVYRSGRAEAVFSDGSAVILHPTTFPTFPATAATTAGNMCGKIIAAAVIRDRFHPVPSVLSSPAKPRCRRLHIFSHVVWPSTDGAERLQDGRLRVVSLDQKARLTLAPHGRSYVVEWWQAMAPAPGFSQRGQGDAVDGDAVDTWQALEKGLQLDVDAMGDYGDDISGSTKSTNPVGYEHVHQVQCFCVAEGVQVQLPWLYPLFLCLMLQVSPGHVAKTMAAKILCLKEQLQEALASGQLLDSGKGVTAPLPSLPDPANPDLMDPMGGGTATMDPMNDPQNGRSRGCDDVSPAVSMGEVSEGCVMVQWTPQGTFWLHGEGTLDVQVMVPGADLVPGQWLVMESSLKGRFWKRHHGPNGSALYPEVPEILYHDMKSSGSSQVLPLIDEAVAWLHHNALAGTALGPPFKAPPLKRGSSTEGKGWVPKVEMSEGNVHLTIFTSSFAMSKSKDEVPHLLRLLLSDGSRLSCTLPSWPTSNESWHTVLQGQCFRLVTATGDVLRHSFNAPGPGKHAVKSLMALLHRLGERQTFKDVTNIDIIAQGALRRSRLACAACGLGIHPVVDGAIPDVHGLTPGDALQRCERTCESIGKILAQ